VTRTESALAAFGAALGELVARIPADVRLAISVQQPEGYRWLRRAPDWVSCTNRRTLKPAGTGATVTLHAPDGEQELLELGEALVAAAARVHDLERQREGLFDELGVSYESLSAIYEIGSDPSLLISPTRALAKIIDHAAGFEAGLKAAVWLVRDGQLIPVHWRDTAPPVPRDPGYGLVGRAMADRRGIIVNSRAELKSGEPELADAHRIAVAPLVCREEAQGALVVWHEQPGEFDSKLMGLLTTLSAQAALILEQERLRKDAVAGEKLRREIEISGNIQQILLFGRTPSRVTGLEVGTVAQASRQIDGDFFGFFHHGGGIFDLVLGDVMGKGIPAALVGAAVKSQFLRFASTTRPSGRRIAPSEPSAIVAAVHRQVAGQLIDLGRFVTAIYARFDVRSRLLTYVDCGHTDALRYRAAAESVDICHADLPRGVNLPLGFTHNARYEQVSVPFDPGDVFLFYSDGITEARAVDGEFYGVESLAQTLRQSHGKGAQGLAETIRSEAVAFAGERGIEDDLTCIVVKVEGDSDRERPYLEVRNVKGALGRVRKFVTSVCEQLSGTPVATDEIAELHVALTEAASNVFRHAYHDAPDGLLRIEAFVEADELHFVLTDTGAAFDISQVKPPRFDGSVAGGFGVYLIRQIMDIIDYTREPGGLNRLELIRRLPGSHPPIGGGPRT